MVYPYPRYDTHTRIPFPSPPTGFRLKCLPGSLQISSCYNQIAAVHANPYTNRGSNY